MHMENDEALINWGDFDSLGYLTTTTASAMVAVTHPCGWFRKEQK